MSRAPPAVLIEEIEFTAVRSQGAGGQNVNKVASAIHLRYDIRAASLPGPVKDRLLESKDRRITSEGVIVIKSQQYRTQERNRQAAIERLQAMVDAAATPPVTRVPTRPTLGSRKRRLEDKSRRSEIKSRRSRPLD
ncbi:MAG: alternative ribosome rescue aminoacyl-tRNA hydrolase ArfB [Burkholderiaceae bacterium]